MTQEHDLTTPDGVVAHMEATTSLRDWGRRCDEVKAANGDDYPGFWYEAIMLSGIGDRVLGRYGSDAKLRMRYVINDAKRS
jgi:hypothetical protein